MAEVNYSNYSVEMRKHRVLLVYDNGDASVFEDTPSAQMDKARMRKLRGELSIVKELVGRWEKFFESEDRRESEYKQLRFSLSAVKHEVVEDEPVESNVRPKPAVFQPVAGPEPTAFQPVAGSKPAALQPVATQPLPKPKKMRPAVMKRLAKKKLLGILDLPVQKGVQPTKKPHIQTNKAQNHIDFLKHCIEQQKSVDERRIRQKHNTCNDEAALIRIQAEWAKENVKMQAKLTQQFSILKNLELSVEQQKIRKSANMLYAQLCQQQHIITERAMRHNARQRLNKK